MGTAFLAELCAGCLLAGAACRTDHAAANYFRTLGLVAIGLLVLAGGGAALAMPEEGRVLAWWALLCAGGGLAASVGWLAVVAGQRAAPRSSQRAWPLCGALFALAVAHTQGAMNWWSPALAEPAWAGFAATWIHTALTAAVLGGTTAAMLLGHAYLTHTAMPIAPLRRLSLLLLSAVALQAAWATATLWTARAAGRLTTVSEPESGWLWLMIAVRCGVGLAGLFVLGLMAWDCVRRRSTQSATGILYIAMVFAFLGELAAGELARAFDLWT